MRNQLNIIAASVAVALSGSANAGALGAANEIFVGGATAPQNFFREDIVQRICDPAAAPVQVFVDGYGALPDETPGGNILLAKDQMVMHCTARTTFTGAAASLNGKDIAIYKYNGGSATGVAPVADPANASAGDITYLDASVGGCTAVLNSSSANAWPIGATANTYQLYTCPASLEKTQVPDAGISDVEPTLFTGPLALDFGTEPTGVASKPTQGFINKGNLNIKPGPGGIFGVAVSLPMYNELIKDQVAAGLLPSDCNPASSTQAHRDTIACMPSVPTGVVRNVASGSVTSWANVDFYGQKLDPTQVPQGNAVHVCKRTNGSGTHAQFSVHYLGTNCTSSSQITFKEQNNGVAVANALAGVYANSGSSDMSDCMSALGNGLGFDGDFHSGTPSVPVLPPNNAANGTNGDSTVVPGTNLPHIAIPGDPLGRYYDANTKAYAMGYNSLENNGGLTFDYRFVKIDFAAPTLQDAISGKYKDVYYLSYQNRVAGGKSDLRTGSIRTAPASAAQVAVADAYFSIWNATAAAAVNQVNKGLTVNPDGIANNGDEWETGFVTPLKNVAAKYTPGVPATPFTRQNPTGGADSCQELGLVR